MLDHVRIPALANVTAMFSGLDQRSKCLDISHFDKFAYSVSYSYNSRGFRDVEWPSDLTNAIWCVGDSFTTGLGSPWEHTWPQRLQQKVYTKTINVSMDGASNNWIARRVCDIYSELQPHTIVIMWSYLHRREAQFAGSDQERRLYQINSTLEQDYHNLWLCQQQVRTHCTKSNLVELIIPNWQPAITPRMWHRVRDPSWPDFTNTFHNVSQNIFDELVNIHKVDGKLLQQQITLLDQFQILQNMLEVQQLDLARDGHHFDIVTADWVAQQVSHCLVL